MHIGPAVSVGGGGGGVGGVGGALGMDRVAQAGPKQGETGPTNTNYRWKRTIHGQKAAHTLPQRILSMDGSVHPFLDPKRLTAEGFWDTQAVQTTQIGLKTG